MLAHSDGCIYCSNGINSTFVLSGQDQGVQWNECKDESQLDIVDNGYKTLE